MSTDLTHGSTTIQTRLGRLHVRVTGSGAPALVWHSMFVDSTSWARVIPALEARRTLIIVDGPSAGGSEALRAVSSIAACAEAAVEILDALGVDTVDWLGNAWGGHVGIKAAAEHPDRIRSLIAIGSPTHHLTGAVRRKVAVLKPIYRAFGAVPPITAALLDALLADRTRRDDPDAVDIVTAAFRAADRRGMSLAMQSFILDRPDLHDESRSIDAPTLFVATDDRGEWTPAEAEAEVAQMRNATSVTLHGLRALPALESPDEVIAVVSGFWGTVGANPGAGAHAGTDRMGVTE
jgi:pimeloyl-ACP methyl ester carboxylesterase